MTREKPAPSVRPLTGIWAIGVEWRGNGAKPQAERGCGCAGDALAAESLEFCFTGFAGDELADDGVVGGLDFGGGAVEDEFAVVEHHDAVGALSLPEVRESEAWIGQRIAFWGQAMDVLTSPVLAVGRPLLEHLPSYVSQARSGEIAGNGASHLKACLPW